MSIAPDQQDNKLHRSEMFYFTKVAYTILNSMSIWFLPKKEGRVSIPDAQMDCLHSKPGAKP